MHYKSDSRNLFGTLHYMIEVYVWTCPDWKHIFTSVLSFVKSFFFFKIILKKYP